MFEYLPLGALISEKILVIHGGLGDGTWGLRELQVYA
jgi:diadenosine tetraphosphatase ApaH/serine/threonine PP2A family protein phosphatase